MKRKSMLFGVGTALIACGLLVMAQVPWFFARAHVEGAALLQREQQALNTQTSVPSLGTDASVVATPLAVGSIGPANILPLSDSVAPVQRSPKQGALMGIVQIPALSLKAPLVQGTNDNVLSVAVGHLPVSAMPGELGTAVVAAHNATWFHHINRLSKGDLIHLETAYGSFAFRVTGTAIAPQNSSLAEAPYPELVLETCYPLNALYLTPYRYLVYAKLTSSVLRNKSVQRTHVTQTTYHGHIPTALWEEGLTLSTNSIPMGTLSYSGNPSFAYEESNAPLSGANTLEELYAGWLHASAHRNREQLHFLLPQFHGANPLFGASINAVRYPSTLAITLSVHRSTLIGATGHIDLQLDGSTYQVTMTARVIGKQMTLTSLHFSR